MNQGIAFLTTIFPMNINYLHDFFDSLKKQTYKKFNIIVVNDGYDNFEEIKIRYSELNIIELRYSNTPAKNREYGINYIIDNNYDILIFGDSDDYFRNNRVEKSIELLTVYDIVVNDLSLFNGDSLYNDKYISNRIKNSTEVDLGFIKNKNIFGMSNTAIKVKILNKVSFDKDIIAVDWHLFTILLIEGYKAVFTNETETFYRQYSNNTVGIGTMTSDSISRGLSVKLKHYELLKEKDIQFEKLYNDTVDLQKLIENDKYIDCIKQINNKNALWWEDIRLIKD